MNADSAQVSATRRSFLDEGARVHTNYAPSFFKGEYLSDAHADAERAVAGLPGKLERADHFKLYEAGFFARGPILQIAKLGVKSGVLLALGLRDAGHRYPLYVIESDRRALRLLKARLRETGLQAEIHVMLGDSAELLDDGSERFDTVFVDGDHSYEGVTKDLLAVLPRLLPGALVLVHDYFNRRNDDPADERYGVRKAMDELAARRALRFRGGCGALALYELQVAEARLEIPAIGFLDGATEMAARPLAIGMIEPHLLRYGGIRRMVEFANRLGDRGHEVTFYVSDGSKRACDWMPCSADVKWVRQGLGDELDVLLFNHEPQWHLLGAFQRAKVRVFYALHYARLYQKPGSWESIRTSADLVVANSTWTADKIESEVGRRPVVVLGGVNTEYFHPVISEKSYPILCVGDERPWKGTDTIEEAARLLHLPLERYAPKDLPQSQMAAEYGRAEAFAVGSWFEGFGWPGLEALACGVPLVTTDNGGSGDYAIEEETALVVPPGDAEAMADAIGRLRQDPSLAQRLVRNGLQIVREKFNWSVSVRLFEQSLTQAVDLAEKKGSSHQGAPLLVSGRSESAEPLLSIVVLTWDELHFTQACVESISRHTDVPHELIIIDNGSGWEAANYAREAADSAVINPRNLGFAHGMNQGLDRARGRFIAFCNNDIVLPPSWATRLISHLESERVGIAVPAVTAAQNPLTVREKPGDSVEVVKPFEAPPPAIVYAMATETARALGGWGEEYEVASGEDVDLAFKVWANGLDVVYDSRVLVEHISKGTARKLDDWEDLWRRNRERFLDKWASLESDVPRLPSCPREDFEYRRRVAASVAGWMRQYFSTRDRLRGARGRPPKASTIQGEVSRPPGRGLVFRLGKRMWPVVKPHLPGDVRSFLTRRYGGR